MLRSLNSPPSQCPKRLQLVCFQDTELAIPSLHEPPAHGTACTRRGPARAPDLGAMAGLAAAGAVHAPGGGGLPSRGAPAAPGPAAAAGRRPGERGGGAAGPASDGGGVGGSSGGNGGREALTCGGAALLGPLRDNSPFSGVSPPSPG